MIQGDVQPGSGAAWVVESRKQADGSYAFQKVYGVGGSPQNQGSGIGGFDLHRPEDRALGYDFDGDGDDDLFLYRPGRGAAWVVESRKQADGSSAYQKVYGGSGIGGFDLLRAEDRALANDFDGDGDDDVFLYRPGSGAAWVVESTMR